MKTSLTISVLYGLFFPLISHADRPLAVDEQFTVDLSSGRTLKAEIDPRTDPQWLWLRCRRESVGVVRPIRWDRVAQVHVGGESLSGEQFRHMVESIREGLAAKTDASSQNPRRIVVQASEGSARSDSAAAAGPPPMAHSARICSVEIEAVAANWDADVEVDGLAVRVYPLDAGGAIVPAEGMLQADLRAARPGEARHHPSTVHLARWTRRLRSSDFGPDGVVIRLPFQGIHPEFDSGVAPYGALHLRLTVAGHGTFEATESSVRIRPYSAVRDWLQQATGSRFFAGERKGRSR